MIDPTMVALSAQERSVAMEALKYLVEAVGHSARREVSAVDLLRIATFLSAIVVEASPELSSKAQFLKAGAMLGSTTAHHAIILRRERQDTGIGLFDMIGQNENTEH